MRLAYKCSYMKQQANSFDSARKAPASWCHLPMQNDISHGFRRCNIDLSIKSRHKNM